MNYEMVDVDFGADVEADITKFVYEQLEWLDKAHNDLHKNKLPRWRKIYLGTPAEASRNFPFANAANTVVQVAGETIDNQVARVMGLIYATHPTWVFKNYYKAANMQGQKDAELDKQILEEFMDLAGIEPDMLNLHETESMWYTDTAKLGTSFVKVGVEKQVEAVVVGYTDSGNKIRGRERTVYEGPTVTKLRHEDVLADPTASSLEKSGFVAVRHTLKRPQLEDRGFTGTYERDALERIIKSPDRGQPTPQIQSELQTQGLSSPNNPTSTAEWDIWECYFPWWTGNPNRKYRLVYSFHRATRTVMRKVFNFLPNNALPVRRAKLGYRTDGMYGHGYAELLETYQEELSTTHNQRLDNATIANIRALRISPKARALDSNMELYPGALLIGEKDEIEAIQIGDVYGSTVKNEEITLGLVARRAGITPAVAGSGSGGMQKKPAVYSSQGTLAVMQENNSMIGFATAEFRAAHVSLGALLTSMYGKFGTGGKEELFGLDEERLLRALDKFKDGHLRIPIRSSTGSLNQEVDKQAGMILAGVLQRHYTAVGQLLQSLANPMVPPNAKEYFTNLIIASEMFHKKLVKDFGYEQPDIYVPEANTSGGGQGPAKGAMGGGGMASGGSPVEGAPPAAQGGGAGPVPMPGMGGGASGPTPVAR